MTEIVDKAGRRIALRRVGVVEQLRLFKALGPELSVIPPYLTGAMIAASVAMIDDVPLPFPTSEAGVEAALERIGLEAMALIAAATARPAADVLEAAAGN
jgi:hypothetical protein